MRMNRPYLVGALPERQVEAELEERHRGYHVLCLCKIQLDCLVYPPSEALAHRPRMRGSKGRRYKNASSLNRLTASPP